MVPNRCSVRQGLRPFLLPLRQPEDLPDLDAKRHCQACLDSEAGTAATSLQVRDVSGVQLSRLSQVLLRPVPLQAELPNCGSERPAEVIHWWLTLRTCCACANNTI